LEYLFAEELGIVIQVHPSDLDAVLAAYSVSSVQRFHLGLVGGCRAEVGENLSISLSFVVLSYEGHC
jgi:hypothetical protein